MSVTPCELTQVGGDKNMQLLFRSTVCFTTLMISLFGLLGCRQNQDQAQQLTKDFIDLQLKRAVIQYKSLINQIPDDELAKSWDVKNKLQFCRPDDWVSGFVAGTMLRLYTFSNEHALLDEAKEKLDLLEIEKNNTGTHDLGFMLYCSFGNAYRVFPNDRYKQILIQGAKSLSARFNDRIGGLRSWGNINDTSNFTIIVDNMMNLEYLLWAAKQTGISRFREIAIAHAELTLRDFFSPDYSSYHVIHYDYKTGKIRERTTSQGASPTSVWSRGQAWALYGFTMMYRETKDKRYLAQAQHIARFILNHPHLPTDLIPYWDFDAPQIPNTYRDASAGAILASALIELSTFSDQSEAAVYQKAAEKLLVSLSSRDYRTQGVENGGFLIKHSCGAVPFHAEVDFALSYADYYYVEALFRYRDLL